MLLRRQAGAGFLTLELEQYFHIAEAGLIAGKNLLHHRSAEHVGVIGREFETRTPSVGEGGFQHAKEVSLPKGRSPGKTEPDIPLAEGRARSLVPQIARFGQAKVVEVGPPHHPGGGAQDELHEGVFGIHQAIKGRERVQSRRRHNLEESIVVLVVRIVVP